MDEQKLHGNRERRETNERNDQINYDYKAKILQFQPGFYFKKFGRAMN